MNTPDTIVDPLPRNRVIAVFSHNEGRNILACLHSIKNAVGQNSNERDKCFVLDNGSSDNTAELVKNFSKKSKFFVLVPIALADKANAWNIFCHELSGDAKTYFFIDGDCTISPDSLDALESCLGKANNVNAAASLPHALASPKLRARMIQEGGLAGNFYALPRHFVKRIQAKNIRLPIGLIGDDSWVGALACRNLNPKQAWDSRLIATCQNANFHYKRLSKYSARDMKIYYRRKIRYSLRRYQNILLSIQLRKFGLDAMPRYVEELYQHSALLPKPAWNGVDTWFDYIALEYIKKSHLRG